MVKSHDGFGFATTASEVLQGVDLTGKRAIVTGGGAGIGFETARALAQAGAQVTLAVRRPEAAATAVQEIGVGLREGRVAAAALDLADLALVTRFVDAWSGPLHILVNNAGVMALPERELTPQGFEMQFATNFLGHFALILGLRRALALGKGARVVSVSSSGHLFSPVVFDDLNFDFIPYTPLGAYGQSKTACALLAVAVTRQWADEGVTCNALHPGAIATGLQKHTGGLRTPENRRKTPAQGAATSVLLAASPSLEGVGGQYFEDCKVAPLVNARPANHTGCACYALDPANAERLWNVGKALIARSQ